MIVIVINRVSFYLLSDRHGASTGSAAFKPNCIITRRMAIANWTCVSWVAYAPGNIAVNVIWIEREFNACQTHRSMYTPIFNRFPVIQAWSLKIHHFSTFFAHFGLPCVSPSDNRGKCHAVGKRIQCNTFTAIHLPRLSEGRTQGRPKCAKKC